jgi:carboxyl-terminal processing protease
VQGKRIISIGLAALVISIVTFVPGARAALLGNQQQELRERGLEYERQGDWERACAVYEEMLRINRDLPEIRRRLQHCVRRHWQQLRHRDVSYRKEVLSVDYAQAMRLYRIVTDTLLDRSLEARKISPDQLFHKGLEEFRCALNDAVFCQVHLPEVAAADLQAFRDFLAKTWGQAILPNREEALRSLRALALASSSALQLNATTVIFEFLCGACYAIDEYTVYLTPLQLRELCDSLRGELVGVGLTLAMRDGRLVIDEIVPGSAAANVMPALAIGQQVLSIGKKTADQMTVEAAQELLDGLPGTNVEVVVASAAERRVLTLRRGVFLLPSVHYHMLLDRVGYIQITSFHETTLQELDAALSALLKSDMNALVLDLRGNGGGLFEAAIETARRFIAAGIIVSTQNFDPKFNTIYQSRNPDALTLPLVVLIDADTASAAEVLAGALKENNRARLVGQTTFGKGCTQGVFRLPLIAGVPSGGLRLTVAQFFSPTGIPYSGRGVVPHRFAESDLQLAMARQEIRRMLGSTPR